jgi:hypothetical protein
MLRLPQLHISKNQKALLASLSGIAFVVIGTYIAIQFGKGYRPSRQGMAGTGLLAANSFPPGAEVYIDGKLSTATDDTLNLPPSEYEVELKKLGYLPWKKRLTVLEQLVTQTNAELFRAVPSLSPLTLSGVANLKPSPNGQKIAYAVASASAQAKKGLYVADLTPSNFPGTTNPQPKQIAKEINGFDFTTANLLWSPDSNQILVSFDSDADSVLLLDANSLNQIDELPDVSVRLSVILSEWEEEIAIRETKQFALLPEPMQLIATSSAKNVYFSPNEEKMFYTATASATIPEGIIPPLPASNTQPQERTLNPGTLYVYDLKEDRNFAITEMVSPTPNESNENATKTHPATAETIKQLLLLPNYSVPSDSASVSALARTNTGPFNVLQVKNDLLQTFANFDSHYSSLLVSNLQWYPNSNHLLIRGNDRIELVEYDNTNRIVLYAGPFNKEFVYPWPDGRKLVIVTNLNAALSLPNLYTVDVK